MWLGEVCNVVFGWKRPEVLEKTIKRFNQISGDWFAHVDGPQDERTNLTEDIFKKHNFEIIRQRKNIGLANAHLALSFLFEKYDGVIFYEEDCLVSIYGRNILLNIKNKFPGMIPNLSPKPGKPEGDLDELIIADNCNFQTRLWTKSDWNEVEDVYKEYGKVVKTKDNRRDNKEWIKKHFGVSNPAADAIAAKALKKKSIRPKRNRSINIGVEGHNSTAHTYKKWGWRRDYEIDFPEDKERIWRLV